MSSHADTIRRYIKTDYPPTPASQAANNAEDALDALAAEIQRLRDALEVTRDLLLTENQRLRDALAEIAEFDFAEFVGPPIPRMQAIARAALDGTPSAAQTLEDTPPDGAAETS